jgi:hypothetical protein
MIQDLFPIHIKPPQHLAYVEWFSPFPINPEPDHQLFKITRPLDAHQRQASIIPVTRIQRSVHLIPMFGPRVPQSWASDNVMDKCETFFVNCFSDKDIYNHISPYAFENL